MPNEVSNGLEARGTASDIAAMVSQLARTSGDEPTALAFRNIVAPPPGDSWDSHWARENWGTKWEAQDVQIQAETDEAVTYGFLTPWTPPVAAIATLSRQYPALYFILDWEEQQDGFGGVLHFQDGRVTEVLAYDVPESHADAQMFSQCGCVCDNSDSPGEAAFDDCPGADRADGDDEWDEEEWDEDEPRCDYCGSLEVVTPLFEWNGETGCHVVCEAAVQRTVADRDNFADELKRMQRSTDPLTVITARLQTHAS